MNTKSHAIRTKCATHTKKSCAIGTSYFLLWKDSPPAINQKPSMKNLHEF